MEANIGVMTGRIKNIIYPNRKVEAMTNRERSVIAVNNLVKDAERRKMQSLVRGLAKIISVSEAAELMNMTLSCEDNDDLTDGECEAIQLFFDLLTSERPDAISLAQGCDHDD